MNFFSNSVININNSSILWFLLPQIDIEIHAIHVGIRKFHLSVIQIIIRQLNVTIRSAFRLYSVCTPADQNITMKLANSFWV